MRYKLSFLIVSIATLFSAGKAEAREIFLNGLNMKNVHLVNQTFTGCTVKIDAKGNVHIKAPGVVLQAQGRVKNKPRKGDEADDKNAKDYFLVSYTNRPGKTQYDVEVFINGKFVRRIRSTAKQVTMKVTKLLKKGKNEILFVCKKNLRGKGRVSQSPMDYMRVVLGKGFETKGRLVIKTSEAEVKRTAAENKIVITVKRTVKVK